MKNDVLLRDGRDRVRDEPGDGGREGKDVPIGSGVATIWQYLSAGKIEEMYLAISPVLMGKRENLLAGLDLHAMGFRVVRIVTGENATHLLMERR